MTSGNITYNNNNNNNNKTFSESKSHNALESLSPMQDFANMLARYW